MDFEFHPAHGREGNCPVPVCMVARNLTTKQTLRFWQDQLRSLRQAPYPTGPDAITVAYFASAEMNCFLQLGWPLPINLLDLFTEFRNLTNGTSPAQGNGLLGALAYFDLPAIGGGEKTAMRDLVLSGGPWNKSEQSAILDYCESDVTALANLFPAMVPTMDCLIRSGTETQL